MNKMKRVIQILLTIIMMISMFQSVVLGSTTSNAEDDIENSIVGILNAIAWIGYVIAFGMLLYVGAKYALSAANERADVKRGAVGYVIGAVLIAGASTIANVFSGIAAGGEGTTRANLAHEIVEAGRK